MKMNFLKNGFLKNKDKLKLIQKAILTGIGATTSKETIKKAANGIYSDIQKIVRDLLKQLENSGEIKTKEARKIIKELQEKSETEKEKIYKKLQKEGKTLLKSIKEIIVIPSTLLKDITNTIGNNSKFKKAKNKRKPTRKRR